MEIMENRWKISSTPNQRGGDFSPLRLRREGTRARENERARQMELGMPRQINGSELTRWWRGTRLNLSGRIELAERR